MTGALLAARLLLGAVLALAGAAKLADLDGSRRAVQEFGVPEQLAGPLGLLLPLAELAIAIALVPTASARAAGVAAAALFALFALVVSFALVRARRPDCGCFGRLRTAPVGHGTVARNAVLASVAGAVAVAGPGRSLGDALAGVDLTPIGVVVLVVSLALVAQGWFGWQLFRQNGRLLERVRALEAGGVDADEPGGLRRGEPSPPLTLVDPRGGQRTLDDLLAPGLPLALVFSDTGCVACAGLGPHLERVREDSAGTLELALVEHNPEALEAYRVHSVPSALIVDPEGWIATETVTGLPAIEELLASAAAHTVERLRVAVG